MKVKRKVPVILQMEAVECGAASLAMVLGYYGRYIPLEKMRVDCNVTRDGSTAKYIILAARRHGMETSAFKESAEQLREHTDFPVIIHWNFNHFVVLCGFDKDKAILNDPASGRVKVDWDTFVRSFTGIVLTFSPGENFVKEGRPKNSTEYLIKGFHGMGKPVFMIVVMGTIFTLLQLLPPIFYKIFADKILLGKSADWLKPLLMIMAAACVAGVLTGGLKNVFLARLKARYQIRSTSSFVWKMLRLPAQFYAQRFDGDIVSRAEGNTEVANLLFDRMVPAFMEFLLLAVLFLLMLVLDVRMALVTLAVGMIQVFLILFIAAGNGNIARSIGRDQGKMSGMMLSGISMVETVKSSGAEGELVGKILGYQAKYDNAVLALKKNRLYLGALPLLLEGLCNVTILIIGIRLIFEGRQTVGLLVAFQSFVQMFFGPVDSLTGCMQAAGEISGSVERIWDVLNFEEAVTEKNLFSQEACAVERLSGAVELQNIHFGYSPVTKPLLQDISIQAKPGDMIAFSGGSGSGKSTLAKLMCGLYRPNSGQILYDGIPIEQIDHYTFTDSVAVVDQNISLFAGTIRDNVTMWNKEADEETVIQACKDACIHDDIMLRQDGYDYMVHEGGTDFSGGQRQRIEIARAFAANPSVLIMDEATSALDVMTEKKIMEAVRRRRITCFIVAHRLSTIRDADEIILLKDGEIVERGTHETLMELDGDYAALVRAD
ncbi:MAG: NHLP family bacteriocin export ABC transporter peptidase/permease/ATPase subunit [Lachnospiraceae bacterium]|jgi:NHLM bacteriocin system ABC transporter peptidase/ATP-binding protein|nr:NHLP family bacteriocin export ABC transporter peptidase/permease/ATPase subunit [Lachnospiraceae bacterium]